MTLAARQAGEFIGIGLILWLYFSDKKVQRKVKRLMKKLTEDKK